MKSNHFNCSSWVLHQYTDITHDFDHLQATTIRKYPAEMSLATWICFIGALQSGAVTLFMERNNPEAWSLGLDSRLFASAYSVSKNCSPWPNNPKKSTQRPNNIKLITIVLYFFYCFWHFIFLPIFLHRE